MNRITYRLLLLTLVGLLSACQQDEAPDAKPVAWVSTQPVTQGDLPHVITAYGDTAASSDASITLSVQAMGRVGKWMIAPGAKVHRGQPLLHFELSASAISSYQQAVSAVNVARSAKAHVAALLAKQLSTRDQLDQADKALSDADAALTAIRRDQGDSPTLTLNAPVEGTVVSLDATHGDTLAAGTALLTLVRSDGLIAALGLERADLDQVRVGSEVTLHTIEGSADVKGTIRSVSHALNPRTHQIDLIVDADAPWLIGEMVRGDIVAGHWHGWIVPRDAVVGDGDRYVFQLDGSHAVRVPVSVLGESDKSFAVSGAIQSSRPLVVMGADQLDDGMEVRTNQGSAP